MANGSKLYKHLGLFAHALKYLDVTTFQNMKNNTSKYNSK